MDPVALLQGASSITDRGPLRRQVPAAALVFLLTFLLVSGAAAHAPNPVRVLDWARELGGVELALLLLSVAATSVFLQPVFRYVAAAVQGNAFTGPLLSPLRRLLLRRHLRRNDKNRYRFRALASRADLTDLERAEFQRLDLILSRSPSRDWLRPTALGNLLSAAEQYSANRYGLDSNVVLPRLLQALPKEAVTFLDEPREDLEFAVNLVAALTLGFVISLALLVPSLSWWCILPFIVLLLAFLAYRNALIAAAQYGEAKRILFDLYRFRLYEELHFPLPSTPETERAAGREITMALWRGFREVRYAHPAGEAVEVVASDEHEAGGPSAMPIGSRVGRIIHSAMDRFCRKARR